MSHTTNPFKRSTAELLALPDDEFIRVMGVVCRHRVSRYVGTRLNPVDAQELAHIAMSVYCDRRQYYRPECNNAFIPWADFWVRKKLLAAKAQMTNQVHVPETSRWRRMKQGQALPSYVDLNQNWVRPSGESVTGCLLDRYVADTNTAAVQLETAERAQQSANALACLSNPELLQTRFNFSASAAQQIARAVEAGQPIPWTYRKRLRLALQPRLPDVALQPGSRKRSTGNR